MLSLECFGADVMAHGWMLWFLLTRHPGEIDLWLLPVSVLLVLSWGSP